MKRIFITYLLLATCLLANAQFSGKGSGTANDPYQISTPIHVDEIRNLAGVKDVCLVLTGDIDMADYITENYGDAGWYPIPDFQGNLNGCGYTISGLRINRPTLNMVGFFSTVNNATISNITLEYNGDIISGNNNTGSLIYTYTGAFVAKATHSEISRCGVVAKNLITKIKGGSCYTGGFAGLCDYGTIKECICIFESLSALSNYMDMYTGGLIGEASTSTISDNRVSGCIKGASHCSGVAGYIAYNSILERCIFEGNVFGYCFDNYDHSFNSHQYYGKFGGLYAESNGSYTSTSANVVIADTISSQGNKSLKDPLIYRIGGWGANNQSITSQFTNRASVATKLISVGQELTVEDNEYNGLSTGHSMLKQKSLYANMGWDMENVWSIDNGNSYPRLKWEVEKGLVKPTLTIYNGKDEINEGDTIQFIAEKKTANLPGGITYSYYQCDNDEPTIKNTSKQQQEVTVTVTSVDYKHLNWSGINDTESDMTANTESRKCMLDSDASLPLKLHATFADGEFTSYTANITVSCKDYTESFAIEFVNENPNKPVCHTPTVSYNGEEIVFACETEGATIHYTISSNDNMSGTTTTGKVAISGILNVTAYATASGKTESETVSQQIKCIIENKPGFSDGDIDGDGQITITDITELIKRYLQAE